MYGKRKYGRLHKPDAIQSEPIIPNSLPTFVCSKCKQIKLQSTGYSDIRLTLDIKPNPCYRICIACSTMLETWFK